MQNDETIEYWQNFYLGKNEVPDGAYAIRSWPRAASSCHALEPAKEIRENFASLIFQPVL